MSRNCNLCITCEHKECKYWCESEISERGECSKPQIYLNDTECIVIAGEENE